MLAPAARPPRDSSPLRRVKLEASASCARRSHCGHMLVSPWPTMAVATCLRTWAPLIVRLSRGAAAESGTDTRSVVATRCSGHSFETRGGTSDGQDGSRCLATASQASSELPEPPKAKLRGRSGTEGSGADAVRDVPASGGGCDGSDVVRQPVRRGRRGMASGASLSEPRSHERGRPPRASAAPDGPERTELLAQLARRPSPGRASPRLEHAVPATGRSLAGATVGRARCSAAAKTQRRTTAPRTPPRTPRGFAHSEGR